MSSFGTGPYLLAAALCQRAQQDQYGALNIINVLEQLYVSADDPNAPEIMPTFRFQANLIIALASGTLIGERTLTVVPVEPAGERLEPVSQVVEFKGEDHRVTMISNLSMDITQEGVYWFDVLLDDQPVTRIPLRIRYERGYAQPWAGTGTGTEQS